MRTDALILKKRQGEELSQEELEYLIQNYTNDKIPDYQMSAFMMAAFLNGLTRQETANLTQSMVNSGEVLDLSSIPGIKVDKHSTGGVGDKTTLSLCPLIASTGLKVAKMSGRGLGHSGGTIDKLESFQGFNTQLSMDEFIQQVKDCNLALIGQTKQLAPADGKLYALRDVTATVDSIPLIASSIMSKKIAAGTDVIVLDVKVGKGAFMESLDDAIALGHEMVRIGNDLGRKTVAIVSDMNQPLGLNIGNSLEVQEAIETLKGRGPEDFRNLCLTLGGILLTLTNKAQTIIEGKELLKKQIDSGKAVKKLEELVKAQQGNTDGIHDITKLPKANNFKSLFASESGVVSSLDAKQIGLASVTLGAGRETKEDEIDLSVGIELKKKVGDRVEEGEELARIWYSDEYKLSNAITLLESAFQISDNASVHPLIYGVISSQTEANKLDPVE